eukprot:15438887-Alexandrium_andersonii.AAC.1
MPTARGADPRPKKSGVVPGRRALGGSANKDTASSFTKAMAPKLQGKAAQARREEGAASQQRPHILGWGPAGSEPRRGEKGRAMIRQAVQESQAPAHARPVDASRPGPPAPSDPPTPDVGVGAGSGNAPVALYGGQPS